MDESFFFYDSVVKRVWIEENKRPVFRITGSHQHLCVFSAVSIERNQLFRQYDIFNGDTFLDYLKNMHTNSKMLSIYGQGITTLQIKKVIRYFEENQVTLIPVYLPTAASPEIIVMEEEVWNIAKRELLVLKYYSSFADFKEKISQYFRTKRFNLNMSNYLLRDTI